MKETEFIFVTIPTADLVQLTENIIVIMCIWGNYEFNDRIKFGFFFLCISTELFLLIGFIINKRMKMKPLVLFWDCQQSGSDPTMLYLLAEIPTHHSFFFF